MNSSKYILALICIASFFSFLYSFRIPLGYDSGLYASLAHSIYKNGQYSFNGEFSNVSPGFPLYLSMFFIFGQKGIFLAVPVTAVSFTIICYFLLKDEFLEVYAFFGALLIFFSLGVFENSVGVLWDIPMLSIIMLFYLLHKKDIPLRNLVLGILLSFGILIKYVSLLYMVPVLFNYKKKDLYSILIALGIVSLWIYFILSKNIVLNFNNLIFSGFIGFEYTERFLIWFFPPLFLISFFGIIRCAKEKSESLRTYLPLFLITLISIFFWKIKSDRYLHLLFQ